MRKRDGCFDRIFATSETLRKVLLSILGILVRNCAFLHFTVRVALILSSRKYNSYSTILNLKLQLNMVFTQTAKFFVDSSFDIEEEAYVCITPPFKGRLPTKMDWSEFIGRRII